MDVELSAGIGFAAAALSGCIATPFAIRVANRTGFHDRPRGYRAHAAPTPFLGGAAVLASFLLAAALVGGVSGRYWLLLVCAFGMWGLGTTDDRIAVPPKWRLLAEAGAAVALYAVGLGWDLPGAHPVDLLLTIVWVVGIVNAFNLMDNLDGACGSVAFVSAAGIGILAVSHNLPALAGMAFSLAGASAAFLRWNLAGPAKIFLGDGGSMPVGFLVAGLAMATSRHQAVGDASLLAAGLMAGVVILDTTLVSVSRARRGVSLLTGGRDHLSHRLLLALRSPRLVAGALASGQALLCAAAFVGDRLGAAALATVATVAVLVGIVAIAVLDSARWRPAGIAVTQPVGTESDVVAPERGSVGVQELGAFGVDSA